MHQPCTWKGMPEDSALSLQTWILIYCLFSEKVFININMPLESYLLRLCRGTESRQSCSPSGSLFMPPLSHQGPGIRKKLIDSRSLPLLFFFLVSSALGFNIWFQEIIALIHIQEILIHIFNRHTFKTTLRSKYGPCIEWDLKKMIFKHFEGLDWQPKVNDKGSPNVLGVTAYIHFSSAQYLEAYSRC